METVPTPEEIRVLRGGLSRAEFASRLGVTPLTVYRWELAPDSPELRRPRGKVLARLRAYSAAHSPPGEPRNESAANVAAASPPRPPGASELSPAERALLAPALAGIDACKLEGAEAELLRLLSSETLIGEPARALASVAIAKLQLLVRHDARGAFSTLLGLGPALGRLPPEVQLDYHLVSAFLHAHSDPQLFDAGRTHHHAALAEPLLGPADGDRRFFLWFARFHAAVVLHEPALVARALERFQGVRELATTPLQRLLALEAAAFSTLSVTDVGEAARRIREFAEAAARHPLPLHRLRARTWTAEVLLEQAAPPDQILPLLEEAEALAREHRIVAGIHTMMMMRNKGEVLARLGRLAEADAALAEAARQADALSYTPHRIVTSQARVCAYRGRFDEARALGERAQRFEGLQLDLARAVGQIVAVLSSVAAGAPPAEWFEAILERLAALRNGVWPNAYRHAALHALGACANAGTLAQAARMLEVAERALAGSSTPTASALLRRHRSTVLARQGRLVEARQVLEAARSTFELSGDVPEAALTRRAIANVDLLLGTPDAPARMAGTEAELGGLGLAVPPPLRVDPAARAASANGDASDAAAGAPDVLRVHHLVVPVQRLATRGQGPSMLQRELVNVAAELLPGREVRLEELDSAGAAHPLAARSGPGVGVSQWFEFGDGVGRRLRLGVEGELGPSERAALHVVSASAALAFEVAGLRGLAAAAPRPTGPAAAPAIPELPGFVAASEAMRELRSELVRLSGSRSTIIITGESGTGKEVVARAIHDLSARARRPYVTFNSAAVPRELFEGQLFGYRRGAFTGAHADHPGVIRAAEGGTLFLDEVGELPLEVQPKLLRFLENGEVFPLGERQPVRVDVRVIAATHRDLRQLVREGRFREDLYYRLQVIPLHIPPLRERREDVAALARHFIAKLTPPGKPIPLLDPDGEAKLMAHPWPGNGRELRNVIERSLAFEPLPLVLTAAHLRL